jgi:hypothetical protein
MSQSPRQIKAEARRQQTLSAYRNFFNTSLDSHLQHVGVYFPKRSVCDKFQDSASIIL